MTFPWKKVKVNGISRLVNDHLHKSQKRRDGSSLVVETGFPTSLVDLFMKNREKWKKKSKRNRQNPPIEVDDPPIAVSDVSLPHSPIISSPIAGSPPSTEIQSENEIVDTSYLDERFSNQEAVESAEIGEEKLESKKCEAIETKMIKSKGEKIRSKMKKLVPKKLRCSTKQPESPLPQTIEEELYMDADSIARNAEEGNNISPMQHKEVLEDIKSGQTWIYKVVYVIILLGLIKGRAFAFLLVLSWYFLFKLYTLISRMPYGNSR